MPDTSISLPGAEGVGPANLDEVELSSLMMAADLMIGAYQREPDDMRLEILLRYRDAIEAKLAQVADPVMQGLVAESLGSIDLVLASGTMPDPLE